MMFAAVALLKQREEGALARVVLEEGLCEHVERFFKSARVLRMSASAKSFTVVQQGVWRQKQRNPSQPHGNSP